jgi:hypothetical protein
LIAGNTSGPNNGGERVNLSLALARTYRSLGQYQKALDLLETLGAGPWRSTSVQAEYYDELARDKSALGRPREALNELNRAVALKDTAERRFFLSQLVEQIGDHKEARRQLEAAVAAEPGNMEYKAALAYMLRASGNLAAAARLLSEVLAAEPQRYRLHEDLGYIYLSLGENESAINEFRWVIDHRKLYPADAPEGRAATEHKIEALRQAISSIEPHWWASAYSNLCLAGPHCNARTPNLGSIISSNQGGVQAAYQPPGIGYVDGRTFEAFARTFFSYEPGTIDPQGKSFQGGVGARFKPLKDYNLVLFGERLIKLGAFAQNNWEARAAFSTSSGYLLEVGAERSWYSLLYVDLATTLESPHQYLTYADGRAGPNYRLADRLAISPFVYGTFRGNFGAGRNTSAETGVGVSLRGFFDFEEDKYHDLRGAAELLPRLGYTVYDTRAPKGVVFSITLIARY